MPPKPALVWDSTRTLSNKTTFITPPNGTAFAPDTSFRWASQSQILT